MIIHDSSPGQAQGPRFPSVESPGPDSIRVGMCLSCEPGAYEEVQHGECRPVGFDTLLARMASDYKVRCRIGFEIMIRLSGDGNRLTIVQGIDALPGAFKFRSPAYGLQACAAGEKNDDYQDHESFHGDA